MINGLKKSQGEETMNTNYQFEMFYQGFLGDGWLFGKEEDEMHKCSYCGRWFKNYKEMALHFDACIDKYYKKKTR